jgi:predicted transcriptional regulator of viral defense system
MFRATEGERLPCPDTEHSMKTPDFFAAHPVFSLSEATDALAPPGGRPGTVERLKHHLETGRLKLVTRGIYAVVPAGMAAERFQPDPFLVAAAIRPRGVFSHHAALELLGVAHSAWTECTVFTDNRRRTLAPGRTTIRFLDHPTPLRGASRAYFATRKVERRGRMLTVTGPERTLVEGFRRLGLVGGLEELVNSAGGFPILDLSLLEGLLRRYDIANLWAAAGWFLERFQQAFHAPAGVLARMERHRPRSPQYLERDSRGGALVPKWNLILPRAVLGPGEAIDH